MVKQFVEFRLAVTIRFLGNNGNFYSGKSKYEPLTLTVILQLLTNGGSKAEVPGLGNHHLKSWLHVKDKTMNKNILTSFAGRGSGPRPF